ncbi:nucleolar complex protein 4 homolog [Palaemon carinicauda]|uniref:nucleolar complex protein 4 homolog n=1 Tax=Palaemon carinicauda TaxID=392227 RepID=UPI0035B5FDF5
MAPLREMSVKDFKEDKVKNANVIVDFLQNLEDNDDKEVKSGIIGLRAIFLHLLKNGDIKTPAEIPDDLMTASQKFDKWLFARYNETFQKLISLLRHEGAAQATALSTIIKLMKAENRRSVRKKTEGRPSFPSYRLQALLDELISKNYDHQKCITNLKEQMECQDFLFHSLKSLSVIVKKHNKESVTEKYMNNLLLMLEQMNIPDASDNLIVCTKSFRKEKDQAGNESSNSKGPSTLKLSYPKAKRAINIIWNEIISYPLNGSLYRRCLILIPEKIMHHLEKPIRLTGFFMDAYDLGGALSLLALQGVFILVNKYNLDYPNFYQKLYGLLEPTIFHAKYRPRFFMLMDRFLSSTHVPEYVIAAFIKKLARLSLSAPASCLVLTLKFIANLLIRYPGLKILVHNPDAIELENDPFDPNEPDMSKCRACESSLWEIATIQQHVIPSISKATGFIEKTLPIIEYDISELVETTYEEVHEKSCKLIVHETVATTFQKPSGLFTHHDDRMSDDWSVV